MSDDLEKLRPSRQVFPRHTLTVAEASDLWQKETQMLIRRGYGNCVRSFDEWCQIAAMQNCVVKA